MRSSIEWVYCQCTWSKTIFVFSLSFSPGPDDHFYHEPSTPQATSTLWSLLVVLSLCLCFAVESHSIVEDDTYVFYCRLILFSCYCTRTSSTETDIDGTITARERHCDTSAQSRYRRQESTFDTVWTDHLAHDTTGRRSLIEQRHSNWSEPSDWQFDSRLCSLVCQRFYEQGTTRRMGMSMRRDRYEMTVHAIDLF